MTIPPNCTWVDGPPDLHIEEGRMTIDPEKLERDIATLEKWVARFACFHDVSGESFGRTFAAARAHLATLPRYKEVEVWRVEYAVEEGGEWDTHIIQASSEEAAQSQAGWRRGNPKYACISITGPHRQRVPA